MRIHDPVIIVGAPRSGTSLMQKLIREVPGFVSVPKESDVIWGPYCHPALNDWLYEGCPDQRITDEIIADIRAAFAQQALTAGTWRLFDRLSLMDRPRLAKCLRAAYKMMSGPWGKLRARTQGKRETPGRLVDKSVHAGLWLNLVDAVFPDARYLHMVRSPQTCVPSMIRGWQEPERFGTYRLPESANPRPDSSKEWWCFPMPQGWREMRDTDLADTCSFQWNAINNSIADFLSRPSLTGRFLRVHLEDLSENTDRSLSEVSEFLDIRLEAIRPPNGILPKINVSIREMSVGESTADRIAALTESVYDRLHETRVR